MDNNSWVLERSNFTQKSHAFYAESDGHYQFRIAGEDLAGNKGFDLTNIILIDTIGPNVTITDIPSLTDLENIMLDLEQLEDIATQKMKDLNAHDLEEAVKIIAGSARSMGIEVKE